MEVHPVVMHAVGAVRHRAGLEVRSVSAQVHATLGTVAASTAIGDERRHHVVAWNQVDHARADVLDDTGALVTGAHRDVAAVAAVEDVDVAVAQAAGDVAHQHLVGLRLVDLHVDDLVAARALEQHCGT